MERHTPEQWVVNSELQGGNMVYVGPPSLRGMVWIPYNFPDKTKALETAARIVSAVNACQGFPTEALQPGAVVNLVATLRAQEAFENHMEACKGCASGWHCGTELLITAQRLRESALAPFK